MAIPAFLGNGLLRPFRRDQKNDFANGAGAALIQSTAGQILGTKCDGPRGVGELPWRTEFGSRLYLLRHRPLNETLRELARFYSQEALTRWEPRIVVSQALVTRNREQRSLVIRCYFDVIDRNVSGNRVIFGGLEAGTAIAEG